MGRKINQAAAEALKHVEVCRSRIHALHYAVQGVRDRMNDFHPGASADFSRLHAMLYQQLNEAYATVFLWGVVDERARREANRVAFEHYLREGTTIMQYLEPMQNHPSRWSADEEKEFRAEIAEAKKRATKKPAPERKTGGGG